MISKDECNKISKLFNNTNDFKKLFQILFHNLFYVESNIREYLFAKIYQENLAQYDKLDEMKEWLIEKEDFSSDFFENIKKHEFLKEILTQNISISYCVMNYDHNHKIYVDNIYVPLIKWNLKYACDVMKFFDISKLKNILVTWDKTLLITFYIEDENSKFERKTYYLKNIYIIIDVNTSYDENTYRSEDFDFDSDTKIILNKHVYAFFGKCSLIYTNNINSFETIKSLIYNKAPLYIFSKLTILPILLIKDIGLTKNDINNIYKHVLKKYNNKIYSQEIDYIKSNNSLSIIDDENRISLIIVKKIPDGSNKINNNHIELKTIDDFLIIIIPDINVSVHDCKDIMFNLFPKNIYLSCIWNIKKDSNLYIDEKQKNFNEILSMENFLKENFNITKKNSN